MDRVGGQIGAEGARGAKVGSRVTVKAQRLLEMVVEAVEDEPFTMPCKPLQGRSRMPTFRSRE